MCTSHEPPNKENERSYAGRASTVSLAICIYLFFCIFCRNAVAGNLPSSFFPVAETYATDIKRLEKTLEKAEASLAGASYDHKSIVERIRALEFLSRDKKSEFLANRWNVSSADIENYFWLVKKLCDEYKDLDANLQKAIRQQEALVSSNTKDSLPVLEENLPDKIPIAYYDIYRQKNIRLKKGLDADFYDLVTRPEKKLRERSGEKVANARVRRDKLAFHLGKHTPEGFAAMKASLEFELVHVKTRGEVLVIRNNLEYDFLKNMNMYVIEEKKLAQLRARVHFTKQELNSILKNLDDEIMRLDALVPGLQKLDQASEKLLNIEEKNLTLALAKRFKDAETEFVLLNIVSFPEITRYAHALIINLCHNKHYFLTKMNIVYLRLIQKAWKTRYDIYSGRLEDDFWTSLDDLHENVEDIDSYLAYHERERGKFGSYFQIIQNLSPVKDEEIRWQIQEMSRQLKKLNDKMGNDYRTPFYQARDIYAATYKEGRELIDTVRVVQRFREMLQGRLTRIGKTVLIEQSGFNLTVGERPSQRLCKPPDRCKMGALIWRFFEWLRGNAPRKNANAARR